MTHEAKTTTLTKKTHEHTIDELLQDIFIQFTTFPYNSQEEDLEKYREEIDFQKDISNDKTKSKMPRIAIRKRQKI
jgi:hypothetical protein